MSDTTRERAVRLFSYLRELVQLRHPTAYDLESYEDVLWLADIPKEPECSCAIWGGDSSKGPSPEYIAVSKPDLSSPPILPAELDGWLDSPRLGDSSQDMPAILETRVTQTEGNQPRELRLQDYPEVRAKWEEYVERKWWPWAEEDRRLRGVQDAYTRLFSMYQQQQHVGGRYEVVLGVGCLSRKSPTSRDVRRHLVVAQLELKFDAKRGIMSVVPAAEGAKAKLEQDMLGAPPGPDIQQDVEARIGDAGNFLLGNEEIHTALRTWLNAFDAAGRYDASTKPAVGFPPTAVLHFAPAVILRKRTAAGLMRVFENISEALGSGGQVPVGIRRVVSIEEPSAVGDHATDQSPPEALLFPLPVNEEQEKIAHQLTRASGVLVQGPPGTGKSHTIANLITHLLAQGKRVLVTSHGPQALAVLKEKLPPEVVELCVFLLGNDAAARQSLARSVQSITEHKDSWNEAENAKKTEALRRDLDGARRKEAEATQCIIKAREQETYLHGSLPGGYSGTAQDIAAQVASQKGEFGWLSDDTNPETEPPLTDTEALGLLGLLRDTDPPSATDLAEPAVDINGLPPPSVFADAVKVEREVIEHCHRLEEYALHPVYPALVQAASSSRASLGEALSHLREACETLAGSGLSWVREAATDILCGNCSKWRELHAFSCQQLASVRDAISIAADADVTGLAERDLLVVREDAEVLRCHVESGGRLRVWMFFRPAPVRSRKYLVDQVRVNGKHCRDTTTLELLTKWVELRVAINKLDEHWRRVTKVQPGPVRLRFATYSELRSHLENALRLTDAVETAREALRGSDLQWEPAWHKPEQLSQLRSVLEAAEADLALGVARGWFDRARTSLRDARARGQEHEQIGRLAASVEARDESGYKEALAALQRLYDMRKLLRRRTEFLQRLKQAAPRLAETLESDCDDEVWDLRLRALQRAWNWAGTKTWLTKLGDPSEYQRLLVRLDDCRSRILDIKKRLAVEKAWAVCLSRLSEHERQHLMAWWNVIHKKIGKGYSKFIEKYRREAQDHLDECRSAIPAWVMPIHRVADSVSPVPNAFDVAIIDEASQSGPECLFLQYIARQIVVVGDEEQISPEDVGTPLASVERLVQLHIPDIPMRNHIGPGTSFFGLAKILFPSFVQLREHFRCVPEIIRFSNDLCYATKPLIPLKQVGAGRLEPPVVACFVPDGYQDGVGSRTTNPPEAKAVVDQVVECLGNESYAGKSFGIICLLGHRQARLIDKLLKERVGADEIEKRRLICGEPYAFQGDERDVIFLSMVSAVTQGRRIGALAHDRYKRAFNVAASRAKEQMWLFHSVTLNDLSSTCYRHQLLQFCLGDAAQQPAPGPVPSQELGDLRLLAQSPARERGDPPSSFDSWFEVDVYLELTQRGYRVWPQYEVAGYHIDLVVEGLDRQLSVECDGDMWHGPERFEADLFRQRELERCGREFWRIRGSDFYRDRDCAMLELCDKLDRMGVVPVQREAELRAKHRAQQVSLAGTAAVDGGAQMAVVDSVEAEIASCPSTSTEANANPLPCTGTAQSGHARYTTWRVRDLPDPRAASKEDVASGLYSIIGVEGPVLVSRIYSLYAKGARLGRVARIIRRALDTALGHLMRQRKVDVYFEEFSVQEKERVVVVAGGDAVVVRVLGERTFGDIPLSELAAVIRGLEAKGYRAEEETLFRRVLELYGRAVLTHAVIARLRAARRLEANGKPADASSEDEPWQRTLEL